MRARPPRLSLLGTFSVLSLLLTIALGAGLGAALQDRIERRAELEGRRVAIVLARTAVQSALRPADLERILGPDRLRQLDARLHTRALAEAGLLKLKIFDLGGRVVYSDDRSAIGDGPGPNIVPALQGRVVTVVRGHGEDSPRTYEVFVPLRWSDGDPPAGVVEVYLDYTPVARAVADDTRLLYVVLGGGLLLLWLLLFRIVVAFTQRLRRQALHDALTGLPNRALLQQRAESALARVGRGEAPAALLLLDLDRFKEVNDTLGHEQGDRLLVEVARRLRARLRPRDTLARLGGDEFAILLAEVPHRGAVAELAARLHDALAEPVTLGGVAVQIDASIGVALCPDHGADLVTLLRCADVAMYGAKREGLGIQTYDRARDPHSADRLALLTELRTAVAEGQLELHYQPKVAVGTGRVAGVEALVRWRHPTRGMLPPVEFVGLAESTGMGSELTAWVLDAAATQCADWRRRGLDVSVAVNLTASSVVDARLPATVAVLLERHGLPGDRLECEISEDTIMADPRRALDVLAGLRALGVRLALDDFGTGHTSLAYLKRLPLDDVKIDRSFVQRMDSDGADAAIVRSTIELARNLGLAVVAEGVESEAVLEGLAGLRCDVAQGYFFSRPLPAAEVERWMTQRDGDLTPSA